MNYALLTVAFLVLSFIVTLGTAVLVERGIIKPLYEKGFELLYLLFWWIWIPCVFIFNISDWVIELFKKGFSDKAKDINAAIDVKLVGKENIEELSELYILCISKGCKVHSNNPDFDEFNKKLISITNGSKKFSFSSTRNIVDYIERTLVDSGRMKYQPARARYVVCTPVEIAKERMKKEADS